MDNNALIKSLKYHLLYIISETNGITLAKTIELLANSHNIIAGSIEEKTIEEFRNLLNQFQHKKVDISELLNHPLAKALFQFFKEFPIKFNEDHIHLTGSLQSNFLYKKLIDTISDQNRDQIAKRIDEEYGKGSFPLNSPEDVDNLIRLKPGEKFERYLKVLFLPKIILNSKKAHFDAAWHMVNKLYNDYNIGRIRLKFTMSRSNSMSSEQIPGLDGVTSEDVVLGLYEGFKSFKDQHPDFNFILSPSFRKEPGFYDGKKFKSKKDDFNYQVEQILEFNKKHPELANHLNEIDTVGDERGLYRKAHFEEMKSGIRKLQYHGFQIRSHHGETWVTLKNGIQSVDNAMNIWHIDALEHGLSLGINPNYYFHNLYQTIMKKNIDKKALDPNSIEFLELKNFEWTDSNIPEKLIKGETLTNSEERLFVKTKFHTAREIEHYQHDVLNRMINKNISVVSLPTSNRRLTRFIPGFQSHPFSWWEKKGVKLGLGTDNYVTLDTNYIQEMLILLFSDPEDLKITKLLMVITGESRRSFISHKLWELRKKEEN